MKLRTCAAEQRATSHNPDPLHRAEHNTTPRPADEEPEGACSALRNQWVPLSRRFRTPASTKHFPIARTSSGCQETPWRPNPTSDFEAQIVVAGRLKWASLG